MQVSDRSFSRYPGERYLFRGGGRFWGIGALARERGVCVHTFNYVGKTPNDRIQAIGPVENSARTLAAFVGQVKAVTGAAKVDLVGHSQGGNAHRVLR
jgi:triacylglycerol esterase/lipase EstA (alpha/beta hydrolase family)